MDELKLSDFVERRSAVSSKFDGLRANMMQLAPGFTLSLFRMKETQHKDLRFSDDYGFISFSCPMEGVSDVQIRQRMFQATARNLYVGYAPSEKIRFGCSADYRSVGLLIKPETLSALLGARFEHIDKEIRDGYYLQALPRSFEVLKAAKTLSHRISSGASTLLTEAAALEYLAQFIEQLWPASATTAGNRQQKRLINAKERLLQDLSKAPTIPELAREVGMNQFDLKKGFREQFGSSVYALFQKERMELGRTLLQRQSVTDTARHLGYRNTSHFSSAFRKQFGVLPSEVRKHNL